MQVSSHVALVWLNLSGTRLIRSTAIAHRELNRSLSVCSPSFIRAWPSFKPALASSVGCCFWPDVVASQPW
eukprot:14050951-Alexandrium_andersonii.AAC.1